MIRENNKSFFQDWETECSSKSVEDHVIRNSIKKKEIEKFDNLKRRIAEEKDTLFLIMHDEGNPGSPTSKKTNIF